MFNDQRSAINDQRSKLNAQRSTLKAQSSTLNACDSTLPDPYASGSFIPIHFSILRYIIPVECCGCGGVFRLRRVGCYKPLTLISLCPMPHAPCPMPHAPMTIGRHNFVDGMSIETFARLNDPCVSGSLPLF